jgi:hypothetical protein
MTLDSTVFESRVVVHSPGPFHADLTIERGRVILHAKKGGETHVRVRFHDPTNVKEDFVDITLDGSNAAVIVDRYCMLDRDEPFHDDPKDPARKGPVAHLRIFAFEGSAYVRYGGERLRIDRSNQPMLTWQSRQGSMALPQKFAEPPWWKGVPDLPKDSDKQGRAYALAAHKRLADMFTSKEPKSIFVVLAEIDQVIQRNAEKELLAAKFVAPETYALWNHAIRCAVAVDNLGYVFDEFSQEKRPIYIRYLCIQPIQQWMALSRDHDYLFLRVAQDQLRKKNEAQRVTELFHMISTEDALKPATYQHLIDGLNNDLPAIRMLSHFHLVQLVPEGAKIPYDPAMPRGTRIQAVNEWRALLPPGEIRPREPTKTKKDKK